jgi:16S rRNA (cytidine1402-2'-O)-methyltransferase
MKKGKLYLIPTSITGEGLKDTLRKKDLDTICTLDTYVVETAKVARRHLSGLELNKPIQQIEMIEVNEHTKNRDLDFILEPVFKGKDIGLMSDAGAPSIADPGWRVILYAQEHGIETVPMIGPSSIFLALMASGLNGQRFVFHGYLSKEQGKRIGDLKKLEQDSFKNDQTQIFMEAPYKNDHVFEDILNSCDDNTYLCIAKNVLGEKGFVVTKKIRDWKKEKVTLNKVPTLFLIYKNRFK